MSSSRNSKLNSKLLPSKSLVQAIEQMTVAASMKKFIFDVFNTRNKLQEFNTTELETLADLIEFEIWDRHLGKVEMENNNLEDDFNESTPDLGGC